MKRILSAAAFALLCAGCSSAPQSSAVTPIQIVPTPASDELSGAALAAEARVLPIHSAALSVPSSGIIAELLVAEGDKVRAGQVLLRLDRARALASLAEAEANLAQAQASYAQMQGGATPEEISAAQARLAQAQAEQRQTSGSVTASDRAAAQAQLAQARAHLAALQAGAKPADIQAAEASLAQNQAELTTQRDQLSADKTSAQLQMQQRATDLTEAQAAFATAKRNWEYAQETGKNPNAVLDSDSGKKTHLKLDDREKQTYYDAFVQAEAAMRSAETALQQAQVDYDTARQAEVSGIQAAEQQVASSQAALDKLRAGTDTDELAAARAELASSQAALDKLTGAQRSGQLDAAQAAVDQAQANLDTLRAGAAQGDLAVAEAKIQSAQAALKLSQAALAETELRAPFDGSIGELSTRVGEYVTPDVPVVQLADLSAWQIETTDLTERKVVRVHEGSAASVTFDAIPSLELPGKVRRIRALGENKQGDITYAVTIQLDQQDQRLRWNMTAAVEIAE